MILLAASLLVTIPSWAKPTRELAALPQKFCALTHSRQLRRITGVMLRARRGQDKIIFRLGQDSRIETKIVTECGIEKKNQGWACPVYV